MFLKQIFAREAKLEGKYASFKNIKFPRGNYQTDSSETWTLYCLYCSLLNFLPRASSKIMLNYFQPALLDESRVSQCKIWKRKQTKTLLIQFRLFIFHKAACLQRYFQRTTTIHPGIFLGRALWADSVSPRTNTIASRDQFKPIRIGENLVVNYTKSQ